MNTRRIITLLVCTLMLAGNAFADKHEWLHIDEIIKGTVTIYTKAVDGPAKLMFHFFYRTPDNESPVQRGTIFVLGATGVHDMAKDSAFRIIGSKRLPLSSSRVESNPFGDMVFLEVKDFGDAMEKEGLVTIEYSKRIYTFNFDGFADAAEKYIKPVRDKHLK